jgi:hypothetical protein
MLSEPTSKTMDSFESELDDLRVELSSTSLGISELQTLVKNVETDVSQGGKLSRRSLVILAACFGLSSDLVASCIEVDTMDISKLREYAPNNSKNGHSTTGRVDDDVNFCEPSERDQQDESICIKQKDEESIRKEVLLDTIHSGAQYLNKKKSLLKLIEERETSLRKVAAQMLPDAGSDRFSRAETMYDRRMHRAFMMYVAAQKIALGGSNSPELPA